MHYFFTIGLTAFCVAVLSANFWTTLPNYWAVGITSAITAGLSWFILGRLNGINLWRTSVALILGSATGVVWMASVGHWYGAWQLPEHKIQQAVTITGQVEQCQRRTNYLRCFVGARSFDNESYFVARKLLVYWYTPNIELRFGQHIQFVARVTPPYGSNNPYTFSFEKWLLSKGIVGIANAMTKEPTILLSPSQGLRTTIARLIDTLNSPTSAYLKALSIGDRSSINQSQWQRLQNSGTAHLFSISGLHLALVTTFCWWLVKLLLKRSHSLLTTYWLRAWFAIPVLALLGGLAYVSLAGWQLPVVRAWLMVACVCVVLSVGRKWSNVTVAIVTLSGCLVIFPLSIYGVSLYLSIGAVLAIWLINWLWPDVPNQRFRWLMSATKIQFGLCILLLPMQVVLFDQIPLLSVLINLVVVPVVTLIMVPLCIGSALLTVFNESLAVNGFKCADALLSILMQAIDWMLNLSPHVLVKLGVVHEAWFLVVFSLAIAFLGRHRLAYIAASLLLLSGFGWQLLKPLGWQLHVFDVGHGSSMLLTHGRRAVLFDTGQGGENGSKVSQVLLPFMRYWGVDELDIAYVSHHDQDHDGGLVDLLRSRSVGYVSSPRAHCLLGMQRDWHNVSITALWPSAPVERAHNNDSCVLLLEIAGKRFLLAGDIEQQTELALINSNLNLHSDVLIVPHHGSKTSSSYRFIDAVMPAWAVVTNQRYGRWKFPHPSIVKRYSAFGSRVVDTAAFGYVRFDIKPDGEMRLVTQRVELAARWYD